MSKKIQTKWGDALIDNGYYRISTSKEGNNGKRLHRLIYEDYYKVTLLSWTHIHHIDGNKLNNNISNLKAMFGSIHNSEHQQGKNNSMYGRKGELAPNFNKTFTKQHRERISNSHKGKKLSDEHKQKLSESLKSENNAMFGKTHSNDVRRTISEKTNTIGIMHVSKKDCKTCKQGFTYLYSKMEYGKVIKFTAISLDKLKEKVLSKGLEWIEL